MRSYNLYIAGYNIRFESGTDGPEIVPSERFTGYICVENKPDILIRVHSARFSLPARAEKVFDAPYVEELNGIRTKKNDDFWSIYKYNDDLFLKIIFPDSHERKEAILLYSLTGKDWDLWFDNADKESDPMEYPLDGLILYYLTVVHGDIMIHASGADHAGQGFLFCGVSGKGKTTMARLWDKEDARIIHDDRLILRSEGRSYVMYNTPVYNNDVPNRSRLDRIFIIEHGERNEIVPVKDAESVSMIMANCIQHNWDPGIIARLLDSVSAMIASVPAAKLFFRPDRSVIEFILENEQRQS